MPCSIMTLYCIHFVHEPNHMVNIRRNYWISEKVQRSNCEQWSCRLSYCTGPMWNACCISARSVAQATIFSGVLAHKTVFLAHWRKQIWRCWRKVLIFLASGAPTIMYEIYQFMIFIQLLTMRRAPPIRIFDRIDYSHSRALKSRIFSNHGGLMRLSF